MKQIISLCDFSNFEVGNCNDGGKYGFKTVFQKLSSGEDYEVHYETTSHMEYCDKCGEWHDPNTCQQEREIIGETEMLKRVNEFKDTFKDNVKCWVEAE